MNTPHYTTRKSGNKVRLERIRTVEETEQERIQRLAKQARMNGLKLMRLNQFTAVTSSQSNPELHYEQKVDGYDWQNEDYIWVCNCPYGSHNIGDLCAHTALLRDVNKRSAASLRGHANRRR